VYEKLAPGSASAWAEGLGGGWYKTARIPQNCEEPEYRARGSRKRRKIRGTIMAFGLHRPVTTRPVMTMSELRAALRTITADAAA